MSGSRGRRGPPSSVRPILPANRGVEAARGCGARRGRYPRSANTNLTQWGKRRMLRSGGAWPGSNGVDATPSPAGFQDETCAPTHQIPPARRGISPWDHADERPAGSDEQRARADLRPEPVAAHRRRGRRRVPDRVLRGAHRGRRRRGRAAGVARPARRAGLRLPRLRAPGRPGRDAREARRRRRAAAARGRAGRARPPRRRAGARARPGGGARARRGPRGRSRRAADGRRGPRRRAARDRRRPLRARRAAGGGKEEEEEDTPSRTCRSSNPASGRCCPSRPTRS